MTHATRTTPDLTQMIDTEIERYQGAAAIGAARWHRLVRIKAFLEAKGFPHTFDDKCALSLVPFAFQEANYDDLVWTDQRADLGHLQSLFEIDFRVMNQGQHRRGASPEAFSAYLRDSREIIDRHLPPRAP